MSRKILTYLAIFSILVCAGTIWWWMGSSSRLTQVTLHPGGTSVFQLSGTDGKFALTKSSSPVTAGGELTWSNIPYDSSGKAAGHPALKWTSFSYTDQPSPASGGAQKALVLPIWVVTSAFAFVPLLWVTGSFKPKKKKPSH